MRDTMAGRSSNKIENLNNQNYQTWKFKVELLIIKEDLWETVTKEIPDPVTAEWQTKDAKARAIIGLHAGRRQSTAPHQETDNSKGVVANTKEISRKS